MLGALPKAFRDGAAPWVLAVLAGRIEGFLADGYGPAAIVQAAEEIAAGRPIGEHDHVDALRAVKAALRSNAHDVDAQARLADRCARCGGRRTGDLPCVDCDPVEVLDVIDLTEIGEEEPAAQG